MFCRREYPRLVGALSGYVGDVMVAEELAQETLVRVSDRWRRVSRMRSPSGWAHRVAMNLATSHLRRRRAEHRARRRLSAGATVVWHDGDRAGFVALREALTQLPDGQRRALLLRHAGGLSVAETAAAMGISEQAVRSRCARGAERLRAQLAGDEVASGSGAR